MTASVLGVGAPARIITPPIERSPLARIAADWRLPLLVGLAGYVIGEATLRSERLGMAATALVIYAAFVLAWPVLGVLVMVAVAPVTSATARGAYVPHLRISEALIAGTAVLVLTTAGPRSHSRWRAVDWLALAYFVVTLGLGLIDAHLRHESLDSDAMGKLLGPLQFLLLYRTAVVALPTPVLRRWALRVLLFASIPVSVLAIAQWLGSVRVEDFLFRITQSGGVIQSYTFTNRRATGPFDLWHPLAGYEFLLIVLAVALLFHPGQRVLARRWLLGIIILDALALLATLTLVSILGTIAGVTIVAIRTKHLRQVLIGFAVIGVLGAVFAGPHIQHRLHQQFYAPTVGSTVNPHHSRVPQTISYRINVWEHQYIPAIKHRLVAGYGPGIPPEVKWKFTESVYITLLLRGGIPLLAVYLFWLAAVFIRGRRAEHVDQSVEMRAVGMALTTIVPVMTVMQLTDPYFVDSGFPHVFWLFVALAAAAEVSRRRWAPAPASAVARPAVEAG